MEFDGQQQRKALTAAERVVDHLRAGRGPEAVRAARRAAEFDQIGAFADLPAATDLAAADVEAVGTVGDAAIDAIVAAVGPGPVGVAVEALRSAEEE